MAKAKAKHSGQFKKGGGRVGGGTTVVVAAAPAARAPAKRKSAKRSVTHKVHHGKRKKHHRRGGGDGGMSIIKIGATALALSSIAGTNSGPLGAKVYDLVQKVPGAKTFGGAATAGLVLGGIHKFTRFGGGLRPYMRIAGIVGVIAAGLKVGEAGTSFKWLGGDSPFDME